MPRRKTQQNRNYHSSHIDPIQEKECGVSPKLATPYIAGFLSQSDDQVIDEQSWQKRGRGESSLACSLHWGRSDRRDAPTAAEAQQFSVKLSFANSASSAAERLDIGAPSGNQVACQRDGYGRHMVFHIVNAGIPMSRL